MHVLALMSGKAPVGHGMIGASVVTAQTVCTIIVPFGASVNHGNVTIGASACAESASGAGVGNVPFGSAHECSEKPRIHHPAQKSGKGAEREVNSMLTGTYACGNGFNAGYGSLELGLYALFRVDIHEGHTYVAQGHNDGINAADNAVAGGDEAAPLAVDMAGFAAAGADHVDVFTAKVGMFECLDNNWRNSPRVDGEYPYVVGEVIGQGAG